MFFLDLNGFISIYISYFIFDIDWDFWYKIHLLAWLWILFPPICLGTINLWEGGGVYC